MIYKQTALSKYRRIDQNDRQAGIMARDAFSGTPIWVREDLAPHTRFALVMDEQRVIIHSQKLGRMNPHTVALDRMTGETIQVFSEGLDFTVTDEQVKLDRRAHQYACKRAEDLQLRLIDDVLVQCIREEVVVLDATTGGRKWSRLADPDRGFVHPTTDGDSLFLVEGPYVRHSAYTHWPMAQPERIHALDLATGETKWTFEWDEAKFGKSHAIYNLQVEGQRLGGAVTVYPSADAPYHKPQPQGLILNATDGKLIYWGREDNAWPGSTGHGHSHVRLLLRGNTAWTMEIGQPIAFWNIDNPQDVISFKNLFSGRDAQSRSGLRPVSCTVWRSTPNWWFGGVNCYPLDGKGDGWFNRSGANLRHIDGSVGQAGVNGLPTPDSYVEDQEFVGGQRVERLIRFGSNALIGEKSQTVGGWRKPYYAHTLARIFAIREDEFIRVGGGLGTAGGRGGGGDSKIQRMRWLDAVQGEKERDRRWADLIWEHNDTLLLSRRRPSVSAMAVSDNAIFLGASIYISGRRGEEARAEMAHRLRILDLETGKLVRDLPVPGRVLQGGIALAEGRIFVATEDGSLTAYGSN